MGFIVSVGGRIHVVVSINSICFFHPTGQYELVGDTVKFQISPSLQIIKIMMLNLVTLNLSINCPHSYNDSGAAKSPNKAGDLPCLLKFT